MVGQFGDVVEAELFGEQRVFFAQRLEARLVVVDQVHFVDRQNDISNADQ